jgi:hypothetical protein
MSRIRLVIDGAPQVYPPSGDPGDHLVNVPAIGRPGTKLAKALRDASDRRRNPDRARTPDPQRGRGVSISRLERAKTIVTCQDEIGEPKEPPSSQDAARLIQMVTK